MYTTEQILLIKPEHFFDPVHAHIYQVTSARINQNSIASPVTLTTFLKDHPGLNELGGANYLAKLAASAVAGFAVQDYAQLIYDLAIRRQLILLGKDISERAQKMKIDQEPREQIIEAEQALYNLGKLGKQITALNPFKSGNRGCLHRQRRITT